MEGLSWLFWPLLIFVCMLPKIIKAYKGKKDDTD